MAIKYAPGKKTVSSTAKLLAVGLAGLVTFLVVGALGGWRAAPLLGWDTAALVYALSTWLAVWPMDGKTTASHAVREDPSRGAADTVVLGAGLASLVAVGVLLVGGSSAQGSTKALMGGLAIASVVISWIMVHTVFTLRYAELYYSDKPGGVQFEGTSQPSYKDFAYLAFTVGMTFQVSDTGFQNTQFRATALRHALISYLFGTVIVATTINLVAGLTK